MNVTLKLPDDVLRAARHRAVDANQSLSAWLTGLIKRELLPARDAPSQPADFLEALPLKDAPGWFYERDLPLESRQTGKVREFSLGD